MPAFNSAAASQQKSLLVKGINTIGRFLNDAVQKAKNQATLNYDGSNSFRQGDKIYFPNEAEWNDAMVALEPNARPGNQRSRVAIGVMVGVLSPGETELHYLPFYLGTAKRRAALLKNPDDPESKELWPFNDDAHCDWAGKNVTNDEDNLCLQICKVRTNDYDALKTACGLVVEVARRSVKTLVFPRNNQNNGERVRGDQTLLDLTIVERPTSGAGAPPENEP